MRLLGFDAPAPRTQFALLASLCCSAALSLFAADAADAEWSAGNGPLKTRWTDEVSPDNVWPEYPRPQMRRDAWTSLNGLWSYAITAKDAEQPTKWAGEILVPFAAESALSGVMKSVSPEQRLWYRRTFDRPDGDSTDRVLLHFGAVDWQTEVWVNGKHAGAHSGGYDPFTFDVSDLAAHGENEVVVAVWDPTDEGDQPRGKQVLKPGGIMYTAVTGIWQTVWLETVPSTYIRSLRITPDIDNRRVAIAVEAEGSAQVRLTATDDGQSVAEAAGATGEAIGLSLEEPKLWSPDSPHLYDLTVELVKDGKVVDKVDSYFGMRKIDYHKDDEGVHRLYLNNEALFQYGPLDQGWWPDGLYTPPTDSAIKYDIEMTKQFGMNMARKHVKYESARWYYWCDRMGLLVWQDMPAGSSSDSAEGKAAYHRELKAMIDALHNFPCIVMWVPFNEGWGQFDTPEVVAWVQQYDPTRPVNEASGWHDRGSGDVSDMHNYPGPGMRPVEEDRVVVLGEFGGLGMPISGHTWQEERNWGYVSFETKAALTNAYVGLLERMRPLIGKGLAAAVYTQTSDVEIEVNGLLTYDRQVVKLDLVRSAEAARRLYLPPPTVTTLVETAQTEAQTWRYTVEQPADGWSDAKFDDSAWRTGPSGFGTRETPGTTVNTVWDTSDIWIRRTVEIGDPPSRGRLCLWIHHDEDAEVYLNGKLIQSLEGYTSDYQLSVLDDDAIGALEPGRNSIAVHCRQTGGGQYIDVGLAVLTEPGE